MKKNFRDENTDTLMKAILSAESLEDCYAFFSDLCSEAEIKAMSQRLQVARLLSESTVYSDIVRSTRASSITISNVSESLKKGNGGYLRALEKLKQG